MSKLHCICGKDYWRSQGWMHEGCATNNSATNRIATNGVATNSDGKEDHGNDGRTLESAGAGTEATDKAVDGPGSSVVRTLNRRAKEAYNAYQREYMRKRRAR